MFAYTGYRVWPIFSMEKNDFEMFRHFSPLKAMSQGIYRVSYANLESICG
jgi:hypothetical protein